MTDQLKSTALGVVRNWPVHNLIAHPLSEAAYWLVMAVAGRDAAVRVSGAIHDATIPIHGDGEG